MRRIAALLTIAIFASGCTDSKPAASVHYAKLYPMRDIFGVDFHSDLNFEELYAKDQEIISKRLVCALGNDQDFGVEHRMQYVFRGDFDLRGTSKIGERTTYRYFSHGDFYENPPESSDVKLLNGSKLTDVLGNKKSVPCKVIMTIYMTSPYYSSTMLIPTKDILRASNSSK
jgi:hypothetical protein